MSSHIFLRNLAESERSSAIAAIPSEKRDAIIRRAVGALPGVDVRGAASVADALAKAGADFEVGLRPIMAVLSAEEAVEVPFAMANVRLDTSKPLGVVGDTYGVVQTGEWLAGAQVLMDQGAFEPMSVATIEEGRRVQMIGLIGASEIPRLGTRPDTLAHVGIFETAHDGRRSCAASLYTINLVCLNGLTTKELAARVVLRHTSRAVDRIAEMQETMLGLQRAAIEESEIFADLGSRRMSRADFRRFAAELLDSVRGEVAEEASNRKRLRRERDLEELDQLFEHGVGNVGQSAADAWGALTEWLTVRREQYRDSAKLAKAWDSQVSGHGARIRSRGLALLRR